MAISVKSAGPFSGQILPTIFLLCVDNIKRKLVKSNYQLIVSQVVSFGTIINRRGNYFIIKKHIYEEFNKIKSRKVGYRFCGSRNGIVFRFPNDSGSNQRVRPAGHDQ